MPSRTNRPTKISVLFFAISIRFLCLTPLHGVENIIAVRMKSIASTASEEKTTVRVVA